MQYQLKPPFIITARLMAGVKVSENSYISIGYGQYNGEGRMCYEVWIDIGDKEYSVDDLKSGCQGGTLQEGMESLLSFLCAAADAYRYEMGGRQSENSDLFVPEVMEWAYQHDGELQMLQCEIEETPDLIIETDDGARCRTKIVTLN